MRKPIRAVAILIKGENVLLMQRKKDGKEYWVFPGGGVKEDETIDEAVLRELKEETSIEAKAVKLLYHHHLIGNSDQYFYLCEYISGVPKLGNFNEMKNQLDGKGFYEPLWIDVHKLPKLLVYPLEIRDWLTEDLKNHFQDTPRNQSLRIDELRQEL